MGTAYLHISEPAEVLLIQLQTQWNSWMILGGSFQPFLTSVSSPVNQVSFSSGTDGFKGLVI